MTMENDGSHSDSERVTAPLTQDVLVRWKSEIREFFNTTRRKLDQMREAGNLAQPSEPKPPTHNSHPTARDGSAPIQAASAEDDSLDRLQVIKRRLAAQLENSRS